MLCSVCGKDHPVENIEKSFQLPDDVFALSEEDREERARTSANFCTLEDRVFVRGLVPVPIVDKDDVYCWGVWAEVSWDTYSELYNTWDSDDSSDVDDLEGKLANSLPVYEGTTGLDVRIVRKSDTRPFFYVVADHPLRDDQRKGITVDMPVHYAHL